MGYKPKTKLYKHQKHELLTRGREAGRVLAWQMRTGKSKQCVDNSAALILPKQITGVIVFAPNGVHEDWILKQFPDHCGVPWEGMVFKSSQTKTAKYKAAVESITTPDLSHLKVLTINDESCWRPEAKKLIGRFIKKHPTFFFVVDEAHRYGNPTSKRTKVAQYVGHKAKYTRLLSGTISGNSPLRLFSIFNILKFAALGYAKYGEFKFDFAIERMMETSGGKRFPQVVGYRNLDKLQALIAPYMSVVLRSDVDEMPILLPVPKLFELEGKQRKLYDQLVKKSWIEIEAGGERIAYEGGVKALKLQQIINGFWIGPEQKIIQLFDDDDDNPKIAILRNEIENVCLEAGEKMIVWCPFKEDIRKVTALADRMKVRALQYYGDVKPDLRRKNEIEFRESKKPIILVAQAKAGGAGKDFASKQCKTVLWYSPTQNLIDFEQASDRATKMGEQDIALLTIMGKNTLDEPIAKDLQDRINVADVLSRGGLAKYIGEMNEAG